MATMSAQIIPFNVRRTPEWPKGRLGAELEALAQRAYERKRETGRPASLEVERRGLLAAFLEMEAQLR